MALIVKSFEFNMFGENTFIIFDDESKEGYIIDPGMMTEYEKQVTDTYIKAKNIKIKHLLLTHLHIDHVMGVSHIKETFGLKVSASNKDAFLGKTIAQQIQRFHLPINVPNVEIENDVKDGDLIKLGENTIVAISTPGHSLGGLSFYSEEFKFVITGDTLFNGSIGRTDLPGGDYATLIKSITNKLLTLPGDTIVYPGHGMQTTISNETKFNPYL